MTWAQDVPTETVAQKAVLLLLADEHSKTTGLCSCSVSTLARQTSLSQRHVTRILGRLEVLRIIVREQQPGRRVMYRFPDFEQREVDRASRRDGAEPLTRVSPLTNCHPRHPCHPTPDTHVTPPLTPMSPLTGLTGLTGKQPPPVSPASLVASDGVTVDFAKWYAAFRRKVGPEKARTAWAKLSNAQQVRAYEDTVVRQRSSRDPAYRRQPCGRDTHPHPATYLNQHRFDDEWTPETRDDAEARKRGQDGNRIRPADRVKAAAAARIRARHETAG